MTTKIADRLAVEVRLFAIHVAVPSALYFATWAALKALRVPWPAALGLAYLGHRRTVAEARKIRP